MEPSNIFYAPKQIESETIKNLSKIQKHTQLTKNELETLLFLLFQRIRLVNEYTVSDKNRKKAYELCQAIDPSDTPFIALSLETSYPLWTGDKKLKNHLKKMGYLNFFGL